MYSTTFSDTLVEEELPKLVKENRGKSRHDLAVKLTDCLKRTYPSQYWLVTVYDDGSGDDKHAFTGVRIIHKFRFEGLNYVVSRYTKHPAREREAVSISAVVGSETRDNAKEVLDNIKNKFVKSNKSYASIHVVKKIKSKRGICFFKKHKKTTLGTESSIPKKYFLFKDFPGVFVIVVAPR